jgi:4'-phosphopantetheinyl transferase
MGPAPSQAWLAGREVHVWQVPLDAGAAGLSAFSAILSADEQARTERLVCQNDKARFIVAHGMLRWLLSGYVGVAPEALSFRRGPHGKPELHGSGGQQAVRFSMSHSGGTALYAVAKGRCVGTDVEVVRSLDISSIAERFLSPAERAALGSLPEGEAVPAFFRSWTLKEAYSKARGLGMLLAFERFTVTVGVDEPATLLGVDGEPDEPARWSLCDLHVGEGCAAALAVEGCWWSLKQRARPAEGIWG